MNTKSKDVITWRVWALAVALVITAALASCSGPHHTTSCQLTKGFIGYGSH